MIGGVELRQAADEHPRRRGENSSGDHQPIRKATLREIDPIHRQARFDAHARRERDPPAGEVGFLLVPIVKRAGCHRQPAGDTALLAEFVGHPDGIEVIAANGKRD